jgi:antitoxin (DNA-binding transcriptional repressor) of toxin-antitoxin stability system
MTRVHRALHRLAHRRRVEGREHDVAAIHRAERVEHGDAVARVVPLDERAHPAHLEGREPRAGTIGGAAIERNAQEDGADPGRNTRGRRDDRQPEERDLPMAQVLERGGLGHGISRRRWATSP